VKDTNYSLFATRLRQLRKRAGLRQEELANLLNIHRTAYTKYETDRACPDQEGLLKLASCFHVSLDYLLGAEGAEAVPSYQLENGEPVVAVNAQELQLLADFRQLDAEQRQKIVEQVHESAHPQR